MTNKKLVDTIEMALESLSYGKDTDLVSPVFRCKVAKVIANAIEMAERNSFFHSEDEIESFIESSIEEIDILTEDDVEFV